MRPLVLLACALPLWAAAQYNSDTLRARMVVWNAVNARSAAMSIEDVNSDEPDINGQLGRALAGVLKVPGLSDRAIDSLIPPDDLQRVRSADGRLTIFQWDERTGGTFLGQLNVVFFRDTKGAGHAVGCNDEDASWPGDTWSRGGGYSAIHLLQRTDSSALYVCEGSVKGCSSCCSELLSVIELTRDSIHFDYPAFALGKDRNEEPLLGPTWELTARCGDVTRFAYDPKHKLLRYTYSSDDLTPVHTEEGPRKVVHGTVRFDGTRFVMR